jgi:hypothetical protein
MLSKEHIDVDSGLDVGSQGSHSHHDTTPSLLLRGSHDCRRWRSTRSPVNYGQKMKAILSEVRVTLCVLTAV